MPNRIKELRKEFNMTQIRLSIELEVAQETVSAYENQKHYPSYPQLVKMSRLFHASIDYIMGLSDVRHPVQPAADQKLARLLSLAANLSDKQLDLTLAYMQGMLDSSH